MTTTTLKGLAGVLAVLVFAGAGCNARLQQTLAMRKQQIAALGTDKTDLQAKLTTADIDRSRLADELKKLVAAQSELRRTGGSRPGRGRPIRPIGSRRSERLVNTYSLVGTNILAASGRARLTQAGKKALNIITAELTTKYGGKTIRVYGHTDNMPIKKSRKYWQDNLDLSANRAMAVTRHLISKGIRADRIETVAMGPARPVASNATKVGRARNRRVEMVVVE